DSYTGDVDFEHGDIGGLATAVAPTAELQAWLTALITEGRAEVRSHPSTAAVNGKSASIFIGSERYIRVVYSQYGQQQERIEVVPVGVKLTVRPWTGGNQEITTEVEVDVSNIVELDPETGVPRLSTRSAKTTLRTQAGETIVIGGLSQKQEETTYRRIPILGSLPIIGPLFRSRTEHTSTTELVILVRPRLLDESGRLPAQEDEQMRRQFLQPGDLGYREEAAQ
ncbi:MAG: type II and III secretion system protein, partial [Armatimonadetes bacterium]|nr:type II and III secretion system protein [Armatimonadota bacterium]